MTCPFYFCNLKYLQIPQNLPKNISILTKIFSIFVDYLETKLYLEKTNLTQAKKSGKFNFLFSLSSHIAYILYCTICICIVKMSFNANAIKKESEDSDNVIFIKQEVDLTQVCSSTHVSESKFGQL